MSSSSMPIVVLGASAGGVQALCAVVGGLPGSLPAAVFVVLHIPAHIPSQLPGILQRSTAMTVVPAQDNADIHPGHVYVAPADRHLLVEPGRVRVTRGPRENRARPAIDALFRSAAAAFGPRVVGVVLTGALDDGTAGLWAIKDRGGVALVQDPASAEYQSMPESALQHVRVDKVLPLERLPAEITRLVCSLPENPVDSPSPEPMRIENIIAREGRALELGVMSLGRVSEYTCPECRGVLVQIEEGSIVRFRCHTGHAYSMRTLLAELDLAIDNGLWATLRAIEERILLLRRTAERAAEAGHEAGAVRCRAQADEALRRAEPLRKLVLDARWLGPPQDGA